MTPPSTDERELVARLRRESSHVFPQAMRDGHAYHSTAFALDKAADKIESLLSERTRMEERVRELGGGCDANDGGLHSVMGTGKDASAALSRSG